MKYLKTFKLHEELDKTTYLSAANKLASHGHKKRASRLKDHANTLNGPDALTFTIDYKEEIVASVKKLNIKQKPRYTENVTKPVRSFMDKLKRANKEEKREREIIGYSYDLEVTFDNGSSIIHRLGTGYKPGFDNSKGRTFEEIGGGWDNEWRYSQINFKDRKDAVKYVKRCNDYINSQTLEYLEEPKLLNVNSHYRD